MFTLRCDDHLWKIMTNQPNSSRVSVMFKQRKRSNRSLSSLLWPTGLISGNSYFVSGRTTCTTGAPATNSHVFPWNVDKTLYVRFPSEYYTGWHLFPFIISIIFIEVLTIFEFLSRYIYFRVLYFEKYLYYVFRLRYFEYKLIS